MNKEILLKMANYCKDSYGKRELKNKLLGKIIVTAVNDVALIGFDASLDAVIVAIRGSDDNMDWKSNFDFKAIKTVLGLCHEGFYNDAIRLEKAIRLELDSAGFRNKRIIVTGHSRGGALAHIISERLALSKNVQLCATFGAPRCFKHDHIQNTYIGLYRVVNNGDRVTKVPYSWLGFRHYGKKVTLKGNFLSRLPFIGLKDHDIDDYITGLKAMK